MKDRLRKLGLPVEKGPWKSIRGRVEHYIGGYDPHFDEFLLLQDTGKGGGVAKKWVSAETFAKNYRYVG